MNSLPPRNTAGDPGPGGRAARAGAGRELADRQGAVGAGGVLVGRWRATRLLIGWSWPALVVIVLGGAWWFSARPGDGDLPVLAVLLLAAALLGSLVQSLLRLELGNRLGRPLHQLSLTAIGYRLSGLRDAAASGTGTQRVVIAGGPTLVVLGASLGLAAAIAFGRSADPLWAGWESPRLEGQLSVGAAIRVASWVWLTQALLMGLPIPGSVGRQIVLGIAERGARRHSPGWVSRRADRIQGCLAILLAVAALWQWQRESPETPAPVWPFLIALSILVWSGRGGALPATASGNTDARPIRLSWWSRIRIRRAQRAERGEAVDAARLDAVLERLHRDGFDALSSAERAVLRRVSQRLRQNGAGGPAAPPPHSGKNPRN